MKRIVALLVLIAALAAGCTTAPTAKNGSPEGAATQQQAMVNMTVKELLQRVEAGEELLIIDVREQSEWDQGHIEGARLMPLGNVTALVEEAKIPKDQEVILICRSGNRSAQAYQKLQAQGYTNLKNVTGGMNEWSKVGPVVK